MKPMNKPTFGEAWPTEVKRAILQGELYEPTTNEGIIWRDIYFIIGHLAKHGKKYIEMFEEAGGIIDVTEDGGVSYEVGQQYIVLYFDGSGEIDTVMHLYKTRNKAHEKEMTILTNAMLADRWMETIPEQRKFVENAMKNIQSHAMVHGMQEIALQSKKDLLMINNALTGAKIERDDSEERDY
jgi:hypothetical protein